MAIVQEAMVAIAHMVVQITVITPQIYQAIQMHVSKFGQSRQTD